MDTSDHDSPAAGLFNGDLAPAEQGEAKGE